MPRVRIIAQGHVQGVGYRALLMSVARGLGIRGMARNLPDGTVEAFCEAEQSVLEKFVRMVEKKRPEGAITGAHVEKVVVYPEGSPGYGRGPMSFKLFEIDYGRKLSMVERESLDRDEIMIMSGLMLQERVDDGFKSLGKKTDAVGEKVDGLGGKIDRVGEKIDTVHGDLGTVHGDLGTVHGDLGTVHGDLETIKGYFGSLDGKYHTISDRLGSIDRNFGELVLVLKELLKEKGGGAAVLRESLVPYGNRRRSSRSSGSPKKKEGRT